MHQLRPALCPLLCLLRDSSSCRVPAGGGHLWPGGSQVKKNLERLFVHMIIYDNCRLKFLIKMECKEIEDVVISGWLRPRAKESWMRCILTHCVINLELAVTRIYVINVIISCDNLEDEATNVRQWWRRLKTPTTLLPPACSPSSRSMLALSGRH